MSGVPNTQLAPPGWLDYALLAGAILILVGAGFLIGAAVG